MAKVNVDVAKLEGILTTLLPKVYAVRGASYSEASVLIGIVDGKHVRLSVELPENNEVVLERFACLKGGA